MSEVKYFVSPDDVETQEHPWGLLRWMSEPRVTGTGNMTTGHIAIKPGQGHTLHNHEGCEEILYFLKGEALQTIKLPEGTIERKMAPGELVYIPAGVFHSTVNTGPDLLTLLAVYQYAGPEAALRADPQCRVIPPKNQ